MRRLMNDRVGKAAPESWVHEAPACTTSQYVSVGSRYLSKGFA